jgi:hypothetical protein
VTGHRESAELVGREIRELAARQPCHVYSEAGFPIIGYTAGCGAAPLGKVLGAWEERAGRLEGNGIRVFLVLHRAEEPIPPDGAVLIANLRSRGDLTWFVYGST